MTTSAKKPTPIKARTPRSRALNAGSVDTVAATPVAVRPVTLESEVFRNEVKRRGAEVTGAIDMIDAAELQAEADCDAAILLLRNNREAERAAQGQRRADLVLIANGCRAALDASEEPTQQAAE